MKKLLLPLATLSLLSLFSLSAPAEETKKLAPGKYLLTVDQPTELPAHLLTTPLTTEITPKYLHHGNKPGTKEFCGGEIIQKLDLSDDGIALLVCEKCKRKWRTTPGTPTPQ